MSTLSIPTGEHGTVGYLVVQAHANPVAFMSLLGKVLPSTLLAENENGDTEPVEIITRVVWPKDKDGNIIWPEWMLEQKPEAYGAMSSSGLGIPVK